jgi:hypothetical protein
MMDDVVHRPPDELVHAVSSHGSSRRVDELGLTVEVEPIDALARRLQDQVVLLPQGLERVLAGRGFDADGSGHGA